MVKGDNLHQELEPAEPDAVLLMCPHLHTISLKQSSGCLDDLGDPLE